MRLTDHELTLARALSMDTPAEREVSALVDEVRERRAADLRPDEIEALRATREEMARFDFLPEIPRLVAVLDKLIGQ